MQTTARMKHAASPHLPALFRTLKGSQKVVYYLAPRLGIIKREVCVSDEHLTLVGIHNVIGVEAVVICSKVMTWR